MFSNRVYTAINIGIVVLSFVESYVFPLAIVKWMIVITKYGGLLTILKEYTQTFKDAESTTKTQYKYSLKLMTTTGTRASCENGKRNLSHMSVVCISDKDHQRTQVNRLQ